MSHRPRIAYADLDDDPLICALDGAATEFDDRRASALARQLFEIDGSLCNAVALRVLTSRGPFARRAATRPVDGGRRGVAAAELAELENLARHDWATQLGRFSLSALTSASGTDQDSVPPDTVRLRHHLEGHHGWDTMVDRIVDFHHTNGAGSLAAFRVLRWDGQQLTGVPAPDPVQPHDLIGGDALRARLASTLRRFVAGGPAVDALIYGPPGTGKSTAVRALTNAASNDGLRVVQVDRSAVATLRGLLERLDGGPRCLILLDDLVFDGGDRSDRDLRGVLEGDVAARPANVVVWATSNRMRLLHETQQERETDIEPQLGRGERSALASRFGLRVVFPSLTVDEYMSVVTDLVGQRLGTVPDGIEAAARRFAVDRGLTPRSARQFADMVDITASR